MQFKKLAAVVAAATLVVTPVAASAANPAASLSVSGTVRAGETVEDENAMFGGIVGTLVSVVLPLILAYVVFDKEDPESA